LAYKRNLILSDGLLLSEAASSHAKSIAQHLATEFVFLRITDSPIAKIAFSDLGQTKDTAQGIDIKLEDHVKALSTSLEDKGFHIFYHVYNCFRQCYWNRLPITYFLQYSWFIHSHNLILTFLENALSVTVMGYCQAEEEKSCYKYYKFLHTKA